MLEDAGSLGLDVGEDVPPGDWEFVPVFVLLLDVPVFVLPPIPEDRVLDGSLSLFDLGLITPLVFSLGLFIRPRIRASSIVPWIWKNGILCDRMDLEVEEYYAILQLLHSFFPEYNTPQIKKSIPKKQKIQKQKIHR